MIIVLARRSKIYAWLFRCTQCHNRWALSLQWQRPFLQWGIILSAGIWLTHDLTYREALYYGGSLDKVREQIDILGSDYIGYATKAFVSSEGHDFSVIGGRPFSDVSLFPHSLGKILISLCHTCVLSSAHQSWPEMIWCWLSHTHNLQVIKLLIVLESHLPTCWLTLSIVACFKYHHVVVLV